MLVLTMEVQTFGLLFAGLTISCLVFLAAVIIASLTARARPDGGLVRLRTWIGPAALWYAWTVALVTTMGSLYYSEVAHYAPCTLCWYQRIAIYPMAVVLLVAALRRDRSVRWYAIPPLLIGAAVSAYHYQLEWFPHQSEPFCRADNPCSTVWIRELGFISLPFMALTAGTTIITLLLLASPGEPQDGFPGTGQGA